MRRPLVALVSLALLLAAAAGVASSGAAFTSGSLNTGTLLRAGDWQAPSVALADPGSPLSGAVTLTATAADNLSGVAAVTIQRAEAGTGAWSDVCRDASAPYGCSLDSTAIADGPYDLRAVAVDAEGNSATSSVVRGRLVDNGAPAVTLPSPGDEVRGTVSLIASADDGRGTGVASVRIQRSPAGSGQWSDICTVAAAPYSCAWDTVTTGDGIYELRAVAADRLGRTTTYAVPGDTEIDNTLPSVTMVNPGTPLAGVVTLSASATDAGSGVGRVAIQYSPAGQGRWTDVCADSTEPYTCRFDTTTAATPDGLYDMRAVAVDDAGNERASAAVTNRRIDNSTSTVSVEDPGAFLVGSVSLAANAYSTAGVRDVVLQYRRAGATTWSAICTDTTAPYSCAFDTATSATPDGLYDLRAVMTNSAGAVLASAVLAGRRIDNAPVRGFDVQAFNVAGGTVGRIEAGDSLTLTWTKAMAPSSLVPGWSGASPANIFARVRDGGAVGTGSSSDALDLWGDAAASQALGLGSLNLANDFIKAGKTVTFPATAVLESVTVAGAAATRVRVTLAAAPSAVGLQNTKTATPLTWTPSATATDLAGTRSSTAPITETGTADRDF